MIYYLLALLIIWNVVVFVFYAVDKYKAQHHLWRIPEKVLLAQALLGGGIGALLAGHLCHHKTRKWYFNSFMVSGPTCRCCPPLFNHQILC